MPHSHKSGGNANQSEVKLILDQIAAEYESGVRALTGMKRGAAQHAFINAREENMLGLQHALEKLVREDATGLISTRLDQVSVP